MKRILNVGCGEQTDGTDFVDLYPARPEVKRYNADTDQLPYLENTFDEVRSRWLVEHLRDLVWALREMHRVLKKGGKIYIYTDNANYWHFAVNGIHTGKYEEQSKLLDRHYALFTEHHLKNHLENCGFQKIKTQLIFGHVSKMIQLINFILVHTPLYRLGYSGIEATAIK